MDSEQIKNAGLKVTLPRVKVLQLLENSKQHHLSAEDIYKELIDAGDDVGLATIYRVLTQFEAAGLVIRHRFDGDHSVYELDESGHHDHLVCNKCGKVTEFVDEEIEKRQEIIAKENGYKITDHCLYIYGLCSECCE